MCRLAFFLTAFLFSAAAAGQSLPYAFQLIPDSLRREADVVLREEYRKLTLKSKNTGRYEVHSICTVMNEQGKNNLLFVYFSDKFSVLDDAQMKVYDANGVLKNTYSKKEMSSFVYGEGLVVEGKLTYFIVTAPAYPITVELNYSVKLKGTLYLPGYNFQPARQSVQHSVFEVETPAALGVRYKLLNHNMEPLRSREGDLENFRWEINNLVAYKAEKGAGAPDTYEPRVLIAPTKFQMDEYDGDMTSWKNFGMWINELYSTTTALPANRKQFYQDLVKPAGNDKEKIRILYQYLQQNMRYVSIQLGIGGFKPFPASFVDEKKYGDCKALSNYLRSALDAVGVKSNVVIIQGDRQPKTVMPDFPADYFNHVILCVPSPQDTTWLECTSTTLPFGELSSFTENRKAMLITDTGGVLVNTPRSTYRHNNRGILTQISVNANGGARVQTTCSVTGGESNDMLLNGFHEMKEDDRRKYFFNLYNWRQPAYIDIQPFQRSDNPFGFRASMEYEKIYAFRSGSKYFFDARLYPLFPAEIPDEAKRKTDYCFEYPYRLADTTVYEFPKNFSPETVPATKKIELPFASYTCQYKWDAGKSSYTIIAALEIKERVIAAADYNKLADFKKQLTSALNEKLVMKVE